MKRRDFLTNLTAGAFAATLAPGRSTFAGAGNPPENEGRIIEGFYPASIVQMKDGSLLTNHWMRSTDGGKTWNKTTPLFQGKGLYGMLRLPNGELGCYYDANPSLEAALGNEGSDWYFCWSSDEGQTSSAPVKITLPGLTMGLDGTMFALRSGRLILVTYSQFLSRMALWGASKGIYKGVRMDTESEGHFAEMEVTRVYYSDNNGRTWKANDGWLMGWREKKYTDSFVEASGVELRDGRLLLIGRSLNGRLYQCFSSDHGVTWDYASPTELMSSDSPGRLAQFPDSGDLLLVWNQISRAENRKGFRRSRLSCAISKNDGRTWENFKTLEHGGLPPVGRIPPDPDLTPVWGDDEVGTLPDDFAIFHYPAINVIAGEVYISYGTYLYDVETNAEGIPKVKNVPGSRTRVLPTKWFYS